MRTELNAVPHASLRNQILKSPGKTLWSLGGLQKEKEPKAQVEIEPTDDGVACMSAECVSPLKKMIVTA